MLLADLNLLQFVSLNCSWNLVMYNACLYTTIWFAERLFLIDKIICYVDSLNFIVNAIFLSVDFVEEVPFHPFIESSLKVVELCKDPCWLFESIAIW